VREPAVFISITAILLSIAEWDMAAGWGRSGWRILRSSMFREEGRTNRSVIIISEYEKRHEELSPSI
jgi:hypothetical protein